MNDDDDTTMLASAPTDPAPSPAATRLAVEDWAHAKGHTRLARPPAGHVFHATRTREKWVRGEEITEAAYDAAVAVTLATQIG